MPKPLPLHLSSRLALLSGERDGVAEAALSALSSEDLEILMQHEIIAAIDLLSDEPQEIVLSTHGRQVITACALW